MTASHASKESSSQELEVEEEGELRKSLTLWNAVNMMIGTVIASGIFVSPGGVQKEAGSVGLSLSIWLFAGVFSAMLAWCYAELGTLIRRSGGDYVYIREAFGPFLGFLRFWIEAMIVYPGSCTVVALTFATYILRPFFPHGPPAYSVELVAAAVIVLLTAVHCVSVRAFTCLQDAFSLTKIFALLSIILPGVFLLLRGHEENLESFREPWANSTSSPGHIVLGCYSAFFAFGGFNCLNYVVGELKDPGRTLPLAILISSVVITIVYLLANVSFYAVLSPAEMLQSDAMALDFAQKIFGPLAFLMPLFVAIAVLGCANGLIFSTSRLFFAGAKEGQLPAVLAFVHPRTRTPLPAVLAMGVLSVAYLGLSSNVYALINYMAVNYWLSIAASLAALLFFRVQRPEAERVVKPSAFS
ncbi:Large neutral amino acids transporter small subunit 1 [Aphelenchoides fujianensis]|nr:Large neutral amino acids transporter small subunit 1 [Aphelenchoides fujianensis]